MSMFCYQCEQTAKSTACTVHGVCGKDPETAALQDLLVHATKGIAQYAARAAELGVHDRLVDRAIIENLFATVTNVDFDPARIEQHIRASARFKSKAKATYEEAASASGKPVHNPDGPATWEPAPDHDGLLQQAHAVSIAKEIDADGPTVAGLKELITYGLKGAAAYADHARVLGHEDESIYTRFAATLDFLTKDGHSSEDFLAQVLATGKLNLDVMALLDAANTGAYGTPEPTRVRTTPVAGKCILVSGHDLKDLELLLQQTEGTGINIYTHSEMLPAHGYPQLNKYDHLVGNYGGAWQDQQQEFPEFPGAILFTTNCIQKPAMTYQERLFTTGLVAWPDVQHIGEDKDFTPVIEAAKAAPGFAEDAPEHWITVGFGHGALMQAAPAVIDAIKGGALRHLFLIGGCDGAKTGRNYYTEFAEQVPGDCAILTLACGKYRFNKQDFGEIGGIPRLLDVGQCNDSYSAIKVAGALAEAFECDINELPLSFIVSWFEQKAVAILLTLLYLGVKDIRLGPTLPAFITPEVLDLLVEHYQIKPIGTPEEDLAAALAGK